jgi:tetratricopeptide (TPR) repeat protein
MLKKTRLFRSVILCCILLFAGTISLIIAQDETIEEIKYKEDYDRIQSIIKITDIVKRADKMVDLYSDRHDLDPKLRDYVDNLFARDMETLNKEGNRIALRGICERVLKVRPRFGEAYFFYGVALKQEKKTEDALIAFARGSKIQNPLQSKAKLQLDLTYRSIHKGSLVGEGKLVEQAMKDLR